MTTDPGRIQSTISIQLEASEFPVIPGSAASIPIILRNLGSKQEEIEISLLGLHTAWITLPNTVFSLAPSQQQVIPMVVQAPLSPQVMAGNYPVKIRAVSKIDPRQQAESEISLKVAVYEVQGRIGVLMHSNQFTVTPGSSVTIPIVLRNQGLTPDSFRLGVEGIPTSWVSTSSPMTRLDPGEQKGITLNIHPPRSYQSKAGRHTFTIQLFSQQDPTQATQVPCTLTSAAYTQFTAQVEPEPVRVGQPARILIENQSNIQQTYSASFASPKNDLFFTPSQSEPLRIPPGEAGVIEFNTRTRLPNLFSRQAAYPFAVNITTSEKETRTLNATATSNPLLPLWVLPVILVVCLGIACVSAYLVLNYANPNPSATQTAQAAVAEIAGATQTAAFNQTAAAAVGEQDTDGDGLTNQREAELGTDPNNPDTDGDELKDGDEVLRLGTDPKNRDTDSDELTDGDEALRRGTDPRNPDTDGDRLKDGEEIRLGTDPRKPDTDGDSLNDGDEVTRGTSPVNPDTDGDRLSDGDEVKLGTNPLNPDTDNDRLNDGAESTNCPNFFNPDSDGDGIIDGLDLDPCDPVNPSLTATIVAGITSVPPTLLPTTPAPPASTSQPTAAPTGYPLTGIIIFESNREGNSEIYASNPANGSLTRLTNHPATDSQPDWSPDGNRIVFTSNRDGNNEIYLMNADGSAQINLTNNPADDQFPCWSPDGQFVAFTSNRDGNQEVYLVRTDGTELKNLTVNPANDFQPSWFSVKRLLTVDEWLAFTSDRDGNQEVYTMRPNGLEPVNISLNPAQDNSPQGNTDGEIVFSSNRDGSYDIFMINLDGTGLSKLSTNPGQDLLPAWSPDNLWIAFNSDRDGNPDIFTMKSNGADPANYTRNPATDAYASWH
jgi:Tol biopolymer transport system component